MGNLFKISLAQLNLEWENLEANLIKMDQALESLRSENPDLVLFPETTLSGFTMNPEEFAITLPYKPLTELSRKYPFPFLVGTSVKTKKGYENKALCFQAGKLKGDYSKLHLFSYGKESDHYISGNELLSIQFKKQKATFVPIICYDLRFPDFFTSLASEINGGFLVIANWPESRIEHWKALLKARAIDTQSFVMGVNRIGTGDGLKYCGCSQIYSPKGELLLDCHSQEGVFTHTINLDEVKEWRSHFPLLKDRKNSAFKKAFKRKKGIKV